MGPECGRTSGRLPAWTLPTASATPRMSGNFTGDPRDLGWAFTEAPAGAFLEGGPFPGQAQVGVGGGQESVRPTENLSFILNLKRAGHTTLRPVFCVHGLPSSRSSGWWRRQWQHLGWVREGI